MVSWTMTALGVIEGPPDVAAFWSAVDWGRMRERVGRLQARIVKATRMGLRVFHGALSRLEPCAVKVACTVLRGRGGSNATPLPDRIPPRTDDRSSEAGSRASSPA